MLGVASAAGFNRGYYAYLRGHNVGCLSVL